MLKKEDKQGEEMRDINDDRVELLERQLAERVTKRVRSQLFLLYATAGSAVLFVLGIVGWNILSAIKTEIIDGIEKEIKKKQTEIVEQVTETQVLARRAKQVIQRLEKQLDEFEPQAEDLDKTIKKVNALKITAQDLIAAEVEPLFNNVESLSKQLEVLAEQVNLLNTITIAHDTSSEGEPRQALNERTKAIQGVISDAAETKQSLLKARDKVTVFFQFAGGPRKQTEDISAALKKKGYIVPGEDREVGAIGKHEVRYFHSDDQKAAENLAKHTNTALQSLGYASLNVRAESFVSFRGKKPRPGVIELWLEIPRIDE
jgi:septal ring factor EnvC (AmiA/AmiB activator)